MYITENKVKEEKGDRSEGGEEEKEGKGDRKGDKTYRRGRTSLQTRPPNSF